MNVFALLTGMFKGNDTGEVSTTKMGAFVAAIGALAAVWQWSWALDPRWAETIVILGSLVGISGLRTSLGRANPNPAPPSS